MVSKLANDEIPQERYEILEEFVDGLQYGEDELDEATMENGLIDDHEDDIEVHVCNFQYLVSLYGFVERIKFKPTIKSDIQ